MLTSFVAHETRRATSDLSDEGIDDTFVSVRKAQIPLGGRPFSPAPGDDPLRYESLIDELRSRRTGAL
jgi:hypothetical protein